MHKITVVLFILFGFMPALYAQGGINIRYLTKSVDIISPDGQKKKYINVDDIPELLYATKIIANGMTILDYNGVDINLKDRQGIMFTKHPVTREIQINKVENSASGNIKISFDKKTSADIGGDAKVSLKYQDGVVTLRNIIGTVYIVSEGQRFDLLKDETFDFKVQERRE